MNARVCRVKRHTTRINYLIWMFNLDSSRIEKVEAVRYDVGWKAGIERTIASMMEEGMEKETADRGRRRGGSGSAKRGHKGLASQEVRSKKGGIPRGG